MLKFRRRRGETMVIIAPSGERIVVDARRRYGHADQVDVAIDAPRDFKVLRGELDAAIGGERPPAA